MSSTTEPRSERGQILVLFAGGVVVLLLIAALVFDAGMMLVERRDEQNAADAAALAGARYVIASPTNARAAAMEIARMNGFDDADSAEVVNVFIPPIHGRYAGFPGMIEVQIQGTRPSILGGLIGRAAWPVGVYAVASDEQELRYPFSMLALSETACKAIQVSGTGNIEAYANIHSNSNGSDCITGPDVGFSRTGGSTINVYADDATCRAVGEVQDQGSGTMTCTPAGNSFTLPDPLRDLDGPIQPPLAAPMQRVGHTKAPPDWCPGATGSKAPRVNQTNACDVGGNGAAYRDLDWILYPGLYPAGLNVTNGATAYLMPGIYWIGGGGIRIAGGGSMISIAAVADANVDPALATWGGGVMIYNSTLPTSVGAAVSFDGSGANMKLKPLNVPADHPDARYNSIVIYQDRAVTSTLNLNGSASNSVVEGLIYVPEGEVVLNGNGGTLTVDQIIAGTFKINGDGGTINVLNGTGVDSVVSAAGLVE